MDDNERRKRKFVTNQQSKGDKEIGYHQMRRDLERDLAPALKKMKAEKKEMQDARRRELGAEAAAKAEQEKMRRAERLKGIEEDIAWLRAKKAYDEKVLAEKLAKKETLLALTELEAFEKKWLIMHAD